MIVTQDMLIKQIAEKEDISVSSVRNIFNTAEEIVFDHLSSTTPSDEIIIKLISGISLEKKYIEKRKYSKGLFKDITCPEHVNIKANVSKYYNKRVNDSIYNR